MLMNSVGESISKKCAVIGKTNWQVFMCFCVSVSQPACACAYVVDLGLLFIRGFQEMEDSFMD